jgi:hypothetical protein
VKTLIRPKKEKDDVDPSEYTTRQSNVLEIHQSSANAGEDDTDILAV